MGVGWAGGGGAADPCVRQSSTHASYRIVIQPKIILWRGMPVVDIGLVPYLEKPVLNSRATVALDQVVCHHADQFAPFGVILWRIVGRATDRALGIMDLILRPARHSSRQIFGHEPKLDHRSNSSGF